MLFLGASIAYIRGFIKPVTLLLFEVLTCLITKPARRAFAFTDDDPIADISPFTSKSSGTEVMGIVEYPAGVYIVHAMESDLLRYGCRVLAKISCNILKGKPLIE